jgi:hypothetical protein
VQAGKEPAAIAVGGRQRDVAEHRGPAEVHRAHLEAFAHDFDHHIHTLHLNQKTTMWNAYFGCRRASFVERLVGYILQFVTRGMCNKLATIGQSDYVRVS